MLKDLFAAGVLVFSLLFLLWMLGVAWGVVKTIEIPWRRQLRWGRKPDDRIARISIWEDGNVLIFNHSHQRLRELEGTYDKVRDGLLARLPEQVVFRWGDINTAQLSTITRQQFEEWKPGWRPPRAKTSVRDEE